MHVTNPDELKVAVFSKQVETIFFKKHLQQYSSKEVDERIHRINKLIEKQIDCTACGNCCKKLEPGIDDTEMEQLALLQKMDVVTFKQNYIAYDGQSHFLKTKPCMFLCENKCSIYENRPAACAGYPHLDSTELKYKRSLWENYSVCPIVYHVIETLKAELGFRYDK